MVEIGSPQIPPPLSSRMTQRDTRRTILRDSLATSDPTLSVTCAAPVAHVSDHHPTTEDAVMLPHPNLTPTQARVVARSMFAAQQEKSMRQQSEFNAHAAMAEAAISRSKALVPVQVKRQKREHKLAKLLLRVLEVAAFCYLLVIIYQAYKAAQQANRRHAFRQAFRVK